MASSLFTRWLSRYVADEADVLPEQAGLSGISLCGDLPTVLCFHGFTGTPVEVELACEAAQAAGLAAEAPRLPGHGTSSDELAATNYGDWLGHAREVFDELRRRGPVFLVGLSLGSLLATDLCLSAPGDVRGLALLANAFWLQAPYPRWALQAADTWGLPNLALRKNDSDLDEPEESREHLSYRVQPLHGAISVLRAGEALRERLHRLHRPLLVLHGARDPLCPVSNAWRVAERAGSAESRVVVYPRSHHVLTRDVERHAVRQELTHFFQTHKAQAHER